MNTNFEGEPRHENELWRRHTPWKRTLKATHAMKTNLKGDTRREYKIGRDTPWKQTLKATDAMNTNFEGDTRH